MPQPLSPRQLMILSWFKEHPSDRLNKSTLAHRLNVPFVAIDQQVNILYQLRLLSRRRAQVGADQWEYYLADANHSHEYL
jgi:hypothetical protein